MLSAAFALLSLVLVVQGIREWLWGVGIFGALAAVVAEDGGEVVRDGRLVVGDEDPRGRHERRLVGTWKAWSETPKR